MDIALVTGADRGIGLQTARELIGLGFRVYGLAADFSGCQWEHHDFCRISCDLASPEHLRKAWEHIEAHDPQVNAVIHAAPPPVLPEGFEAGAWEDIVHCVHAGLLAPLLLTRWALPSLVRYRGYVINIGWNGQGKCPRGAVAAAAEGGLHDWAQSLFDELRDTGVKVCTLYPQPNFTATDPKARLRLEPQSEIEAKLVAHAVVQVLQFKQNNLIAELVVRPQATREEPRIAANVEPLLQGPKDIILPDPDKRPAAPEPIVTPERHRPDDAWEFDDEDDWDDDEDEEADDELDALMESSRRILREQNETARRQLERTRQKGQGRDRNPRADDKRRREEPKRSADQPARSTNEDRRRTERQEADKRDANPEQNPAATAAERNGSDEGDNGEAKRRRRRRRGGRGRSRHREEGQNVTEHSPSAGDGARPDAAARSDVSIRSDAPAKQDASVSQPRQSSQPRQAEPSRQVAASRQATPTEGRGERQDRASAGSAAVGTEQKSRPTAEDKVSAASKKTTATTGAARPASASVAASSSASAPSATASSSAPTGGTGSAPASATVAAAAVKEPKATARKAAAKTATKKAARKATKKAAKPATAKDVAAVEKPAVVKTAVAKSATEKPVAAKPVARKTAAKKAVARKTATKKAAKAKTDSATAGSKPAAAAKE